MADSRSVLSRKRIESLVAQTKLPENLQKQQAIWIERFEFVKDQRNQRSRFFDGMNYIEDFITNENTKNTFLTPKTNDTDVRINSGTAEKKIDAIKNELMSMDFKSRVKSFDEQDRQLTELGDDMTDICYRTYEQERDPLREDTNSQILDDLLAQRGVYIQESLTTTTFRNNSYNRTQCQAKVLSGLKVFPGEMALSPFLWNLQPFIVVYDRLPYTIAKTLFGHLPAFDRVVPTGSSPREEYLGEQYNYRFGTLENGEVEVLFCEDLPNNEYQIYIQQVPMYSANQEIPWSYPGYDVQFFTHKPTSHDWLYGRPPAAQAKTLQSLANEYLRTLVRKAQQAIAPPTGVPKSGRVYSRSMWDPSAIIQGVKKDDLSKLIDHDGPTQSDFQMYQLFENKIEEFIGTPNFAQGITSNKEYSATEVLTMSKGFLKSLGGVMAARLRIERVLLEMRSYNVLDNYLDPVKRKINKITNEPIDLYRSFEIDNTVLENNQKGKKTIYLVDKTPTIQELRRVHEFEKEQERLGNAVRIHYINIKQLKQMPKYFEFESYIEDKEGTALDKVLFQDQFNQATNIAKVEASPLSQTINMDIVKENFERKWKARDWFQRRSAMPQPQQNPEMQAEMKDKISKTMSDLSSMENDGSLGSQTIQGLQGAARGAQKAVETL